VVDFLQIVSAGAARVLLFNGWLFLHYELRTARFTTTDEVVPQPEAY